MPITEGTGRAVMFWARDTVRKYQDCASKQRRLVEAWPKGYNGR